MLIKTEITDNYLAFIIFIISTLFLCAFVLICSFLLGGRSISRYKNVPFESGIDSVGTARLRFSVKFYLVAMFFVIFDVESLYLYAWAIAVRETGWIGLIEATIFVIILLTSLIYLMCIGALKWTPDRYHRFRHSNINRKPIIYQ